MIVRITPSSLCGSITAAPSKSYAHRLLIAAALDDSKPEVYNVADSQDMKATKRALAALFNGGGVIDCGESGTTARLILPIAACLRESFTMIGSGKLPQRPFAPLCRELRKHGCIIDSDHLPMTVQGKPRSGHYAIEGNISSQFISGLLYALPLLQGNSSLEIIGNLESAPYVDMTLQVLEKFGIEITKNANIYSIQGGQRYHARSQCSEVSLRETDAELRVKTRAILNASPLFGGFFIVEGDWSNAALFFCLNKLGAKISISGLDYASLQGDRAILQILKGFDESQGDYKVDVSQTPDLVPVIAATACGFTCTTIISNAARLRLKESDRIQSTHDMLKALGADIETTADGLVVRGNGRLQGGTVDGAGDHRIVMAAATAAAICRDDVTIKGAEAIDKSYPAFFDDYRAIGGIANVVPNWE